jgi:hypothetical protein
VALSIVQSTYVASDTGELAFVLGSAPTAGNVLVAFLCYATGEEADPPSDSWTAIVPSQNYATEMDGWAYVVQDGDGEDWTFTGVPSNYNSGYMWEITAADTTFANWQVSYQAPSSDAGTDSIATPSVSPGVSGMLGLAYCTEYQPSTFDGVPAGWTSYAGGDAQTFNASVAASLNDLTSGSGGISCTFSFATSVEYANTITLLIDPSNTGQTVDLTTPNLALAAPLVTVQYPAAVSLTTPSLALAAPLVTPAGSGAATVDLTTPNLALAAPAVSAYGPPVPQTGTVPGDDRRSHALRKLGWMGL